MTATRSLTFLTTARSWAMKSMVRSYSRLRSSSRLRIWAWTETSRAETISSQTSSLGSQHQGAGDADALALAAGELARVAGRR